MATKKAYALQDYEAAEFGELSVKKDEVKYFFVKFSPENFQGLIVYRLPGLDENFYMAEKGGKKGKIPTAYVQVL